jgi:hypothetical protein
MNERKLKLIHQKTLDEKNTTIEQVLKDLDLERGQTQESNSLIKSLETQF